MRSFADRRPLALRFEGAEDDTPTTLWYEHLSPDSGTEVVARWTTRHLAGSAAITRRRFGSGQVLYVGTYLTEEFVKAMLPMLKSLGALPEPISTAPGVEVVERVHPDGRRLQIFINQTDENVCATAPAGAAQELISGRSIASGELIELPPNGVAVVAF